VNPQGRFPWPPLRPVTTPGRRDETLMTNPRRTAKMERGERRRCRPHLISDFPARTGDRGPNMKRITHDLTPASQIAPAQSGPASRGVISRSAGARPDSIAYRRQAGMGCGGQRSPPSRERSCVHPFIRRVQTVLKRSGSLRASLEEIPVYQARARTIYRADVYCIHTVAVSTISLGALVMYEYLRYRGIPLPESKMLIGLIMPVKNGSEWIVTRKPTDDRRHDALGKGM
jgi:hypothetical protein